MSDLAQTTEPSGLGVSLLLGRDFNFTDQETCGERGDPSTRGRRTIFSKDPIRPVSGLSSVMPGPREFEIIGVVGAFKHESLKERRGPAMYLSILQGEMPWMPTLFVRPTGSPAPLTVAVRLEFQILDNELQVFNVKTRGRRSMNRHRSTASWLCFRDFSASLRLCSRRSACMA